jgi:hypothetical protein
MWLFRRLFRRKPAPAPIDEHEAYARSYGERTGDILRVEPLVVVPPPSPFEDLTGELLRRAFETRLDARR